MNPTLALVGNPNSGKTTLFNALTGLRHKVGNYPGVTVERKEGTVQLPAGVPLRVVDLPGLYSLSPNSPDEGIARDELMGSLPGERRPDLLLNVVDASNLERNLFLTTQLIEAGCSVVVVLTMHDLARARGVEVDGKALAERLGVPVVSVDLRRGAGLREMLDVVAARLGDARNGGGAQSAEAVDRVWTRCPEIVDSVNRIAGGIEALHGLAGAPAAAEALLLLSLPTGATLERQMARWSIPVREATAEIRRDLEARGVDVPTVLAEERYAHIGGVVARAMHRFDAGPVTWEERLDRVFLHRVWGYVVFLGVLLLVFEAMFTWASIPADALQAGVEWLGGRVAPLLPKGDLREMVVAGVFGGVGNTIVFLPQILILFLFITLLEDTGYLARAAFLMDRLMSRVGLHGKSFVPLLSSYACAIPGIMATRTIESQRARLLTILVAPFMSCSARIPVYALMIGAFLPNKVAFGIQIGSTLVGVRVGTLFLVGMYALGTLAAFGVAWVFHRTVLRGDPPMFLMEMPAYRRPNARAVLVQMLERAWLFLKRAGTLILSISVLLWFLSTYPKSDARVRTSLETSYAGRLGAALEPVIAPLGFDARIGVGLVASFAAREVFVSAMGTIYNVEGDVEDPESGAVTSLAARMREQRRSDGSVLYTPLTAVCLMVYYVLAMQCMSTVAVVRRETGGWKWPLVQMGTMTGLAWIATWLVRNLGLLLGYT